MNEIKTTGQLVDILKQWPRDTNLVINIAPALDDPAGDYQWHGFIATTPTRAERKMMSKFKPGDATYTTLKVTPQIVGC